MHSISPFLEADITFTWFKTDTKLQFSTDILILFRLSLFGGSQRIEEGSGVGWGGGGCKDPLFKICCNYIVFVLEIWNLKRKYLSTLIPLRYPVHNCSHLADLLPPEYDTEFFSKNHTPSIHLQLPSPYTNTKKVSHKVKYLLATLIQDEDWERINIYVNMS